MKEYKDPTVEIIELPVEDIIATSGPPSTTGSDTEGEQSGNILGSFAGSKGSNGQYQ